MESQEEKEKETGKPEVITVFALPLLPVPFDRDDVLIEEDDGSPE